MTHQRLKFRINGPWVVLSDTMTIHPESIGQCFPAQFLHQNAFIDSPIKCSGDILLLEKVLNNKVVNVNWFEEGTEQRPLDADDIPHGDFVGTRFERHSLVARL